MLHHIHETAPLWLNYVNRAQTCLWSPSRGDLVVPCTHQCLLTVLHVLLCCSFWLESVTRHLHKLVSLTLFPSRFKSLTQIEIQIPLTSIRNPVSNFCKFTPALSIFVYAILYFVCFHTTQWCGVLTNEVPGNLISLDLSPSSSAAAKSRMVRHSDKDYLGYPGSGNWPL